MKRVVVLGGGISGLAAAHEILERREQVQGGLELVVLEAEARPGGKIRSQRVDGFLCEWGPNGFLDNSPPTLELCRRLALQPLRSSDAARRRFIYRHGRLHRLPESPPAFLRSSLLSLGGRLRVIAEPWARRRPEGPRGPIDETVADFARRRLGAEAAAALIDPMVSGVFGGDPERLSLRSAFPKVAALEEAHGSLIRGAVRLALARRRKTGRTEIAAGPSGSLTSFAGGMGELSDRLAERLGETLRSGQRVLRVEMESEAAAEGWPRFRVEVEASEPVRADVVVSALPAHAASGVLTRLSPPTADLLRGISYARMVVAAVGYAASDAAGLVDGFGFLVPRGEGPRMLGCLFDSTIWPGRSPAGQVLLRCMVGGMRDPGALAMSDEELRRLVQEELAMVLGLRAVPTFFRVARHELAIPQYAPGHADRLAALEAMLASCPGLVLAGNALRGIAVNDCVREAAWVAERVIGILRAP